MEKKKEFLKWALLIMGITTLVVLVAFMVSGDVSEEQNITPTEQEVGLDEQEEQPSLSDYFDNQSASDEESSFSDEFYQDDPFREFCAEKSENSLSSFTRCLR